MAGPDSLERREARVEEHKLVTKTLDKESATWRGIPNSPLAVLVSLLRYSSAYTGATYLRLFDLFTSENDFMATTSREMETFKALQKRYRWMWDDAFLKFKMVGERFNMTPRQHWIMAEVFHRLYDLPKEYIYTRIVKHWTSKYNVTGQANDESQTQAREELIAFMEWCVTKNVAQTFTQPNDRDTGGAVAEWQEQAVQLGIITSTLTFHMTMRLMPFNMSAEFVDGTSLSLRQIVANMTLSEQMVAHVLYPQVFRAVNQIPTVDVILQAVLITILGGGSVQQVQQIYPYTTAPARAILMADIARAALLYGRVDVAVAYGFGPAYLAYLDIDHPYKSHTLAGSFYQGWHIFDLLDNVPVASQIPVLEALGFGSNDSVQLLIHYDRYLDEVKRPKKSLVARAY